MNGFAWLTKKSQKCDFGSVAKQSKCRHNATLAAKGLMSCILIRYTYDKNLQMIQLFVQLQELWHFLCNHDIRESENSQEQKFPTFAFNFFILFVEQFL
jgi:hypothetical protein